MSQQDSKSSGTFVTRKTLVALTAFMVTILTLFGSYLGTEIGSSGCEFLPFP